MSVLLDCIVENSLDPIVVIDDHSIVRAWNQHSERVFGWSRDEIIGESMADRIIPEHLREAHHRGLKRFVATGESSLMSRRLELTALRRSGQVFPVELTITPIPRGDDSYSFLAFMRDLTARAATDNELTQLRLQLQTLQEHLRQLRSRNATL
jgi:sigma-B regulation protein RsbU (phosphoserine phosphatase)